MDDIEKKIVKARIKLFFDQPFFGNLTMGMKLVDATESGWCPTAATDGRSIYYNKKFFNELSLNEVVFVLCHEVLQKGGKLCYILSGYGSENTKEKYDLLGDMNKITRKYFRAHSTQPMYNKNVHVTKHKETQEQIMIFVKKP